MHTALYHFESEQAIGRLATSTWAKPNGLGAVMQDPDCGSEGR